LARLSKSHIPFTLSRETTGIDPALAQDPCDQDSRSRFFEANRKMKRRVLVLTPLSESAEHLSAEQLDVSYWTHSLAEDGAISS